MWCGTEERQNGLCPVERRPKEVKAVRAEMFGLFATVIIGPELLLPRPIVWVQAPARVIVLVDVRGSCCY